MVMMRLVLLYPALVGVVLSAAIEGRTVTGGVLYIDDVS